MKIAVVSLIFKSIEYAEFVKRSFDKYTPEKDTEFWFIANNATPEVLEHLKTKNYNYIVHMNPKYQNVPYPENIGGIYTAWNRAKDIDCDILVLVNSDMQFSPNWLPNLLKDLNENRVKTSKLVESGKMPSGDLCISKNFGRTPDEYKETDFQIFSKQISQN